MLGENGVKIRMQVVGTYQNNYNRNGDLTPADDNKALLFGL